MSYNKSDFFHQQTSIINTGPLKPIIKPFDNEWNYILHIFFKLILFLVIWSWKCNNVLKKKITSLQTSVIRVCQTTLHIFPHWISKPCIRKHKNHSKASSGAGRFAQNLCAYKKSQYNVWNCKSEDITDITALDVVTQDTDPHLPTFHTIV